jgi:NADPH-dependent curcumin reductase CurA
LNYVEELRHASGAIKHRPHIITELQKIAEALQLLLTGGNHGKLMAQIAPEPWSEHS